MKKVLALVLSLVLILGIAVPGTLATESTQATEVSTLTTDGTKQDPQPSVPESSVPESSVPESSVPESSVPESSTPESSEPAPSVPESSEPTPSTPEDQNKENKDSQNNEETQDPSAPTETTAETTEPTQATDPTEVTEPEFDVEAAKKQLMACKDKDEIGAFVSTLTEEQSDAIIAIMSDSELKALAEKLGYNVEIETVNPPVNYTKVGPLKPAVTVQAARARMMFAARAVADEQENGLILDKTAVYNKEGTATITMQAYTTGTVTTETDATPCDIVLVLDESASMKDSINEYKKVYELNKSQNYYFKNSHYGYIQVSWCSECNTWKTGAHIKISFINFHLGSEYLPKTSESDTTSGHVQFYEASATNTSKRDALIDAANKFAENVYNDAKTNYVNHRISVIGFSGSATTKIGLDDDIRNNLSDVQSAINGLNANGSTYIEQGLSNAITEFQNAPATGSTQRKRVVVVFTDGIPGSGTWDSSTISGSANPAIKNAYTLKNTYGATVYSIGMLDDANPELEISDQDNDTARTNKFLHYLSSNYPNAQSMTDGGTGSNAGYYLSASDTESLTKIFEKISHEISTPSIQLGTNTEIRDIVTPYFEMPANPSAIKLYTMDYNGTTFDGERDTATGLNAKINGNTVTVTGFDYNANFVSENKKSDGTYGKKLIIEFTVPVKAGFLGGNDVPTNGDDSGVYVGEEKVELFDNPTVNVPIATTTVTPHDKTIYEGNSIETSALYTTPTYGENAWEDDFVDITSFVKVTGSETAEGNTVNPKDCTEYTITVTYAPKPEYNGSTNNYKPVSAVTNSDKTATVHVLKPSVTATINDVQKYYGETYNLDDGANGTISVDWADAKGHTEIPAATDDAPYTASDLTFAYNAENYKGTVGKNDFDVTVSVLKKGENDTTVPFEGEVTIETTCEVTGKDCCGKKETDSKYTVHVKTCELKITKNGGADGEPYVFDVLKDGTKYTEVTIVPDSSNEDGNSVTIYELPVGKYTIKENTGWSWRYTADNGSEVKLEEGHTSDTITCTNIKIKDYWLNGFSRVVKNVCGVANTSNK